MKCIVYSYHVDELRQFEFDLDSKGIADIGHRSHQFVVV